MHMKEPSGVKAYAFPVDGGYEVVYSDDWHGVPERISEDMFMPFIDFCRSGIDDVDDVVIVRRNPDVIFDDLSMALLLAGSLRDRKGLKV